MKLDQKQMLIVSQLFMAAGKAGKSFDLKRFTTDAAYASPAADEPSPARASAAPPASPAAPVEQKYVGRLR